MRPITTFGIGAAIGLILATSVAAVAAAGVPSSLFGGSNDSVQGTTQFTGTGRASAGLAPAGATAGVNTGAGGQSTLNAVPPNGTAGTATSTSASTGTSLGAPGIGAHVGGTSTTRTSASGQTPSLGDVIATAKAAVQPVQSAVEGALPFSRNGGGSILAVDVSSNGEPVASVP